MDIKQIYTLANQATKEILGETAVLNEDLSNLVDIGSAIFDANAFDSYVRSLINQVGRIVFVNRAYRGSVPSVLMDGWEYGSVMEKITMDTLPEATINSTWDLQDGQTYSQDTFKKPNVSATFFNKRVCLEVDISITQLQVKQSFQNATQLNAFISMIYTAIENSLTIKTDALIMRAINNMVGETLYSDYPTANYSASSGVKAVNLLYLYNQLATNPITKDEALYNLDFLKFASYTIKRYVKRLSKISKLFNIDEKERFTPVDSLHLVMLDDFASASDVYLQAETYHNELTALPNGVETIPYWQGSGTGYELDSIGAIKIDTASGHEINMDGVILACMFDRDAVGVTNLEARVTSHYNARGEFTNLFYKREMGTFNSLSENAVVFFMA